MTLAEVLKKYDEATEFYLHEMRAEQKSATTLHNISTAIDMFRSFFIRLHEDEDEVSDPKQTDFMAWRDELEASGKKVSSIGEYMKRVRTFFAYVSDEELEDLRYYEKNPVPSRIIPTNKGYANKPYEQILTDEEVSMLWANTPVRRTGFKQWNWARNYAIVMLLLCSEIRNKELLDLKLSDVDFEYGEIQIMHGKGNKYRCVDCPDIALDAIKLYLRSGIRPANLSDDDYLFGTTSEKNVFGTKNRGEEWHRGTRQWLTQLVMTHVKHVTGVDNIGTHDLRHVGARLDLHNGVRAEELQAKLGHSQITTTQIYSGKLGVKRKRVSASGVYAERDYQTERNRMMLGVG